MSPATAALFQVIPCPLCNAVESDIVKPSRYPEQLTAEEVKQLFSASSDHKLFDQVVRCRGCKLVYVNPRLDAQLVTEGYSAAEDALFVEQNEARMHTFRRTLRGCLNRLKLSGSGRRLLDVGCAGGAFPATAREFGFEVVGVEPSRWLADFGRRTYGMDVRTGLLEAGMFPEQSFDVITLWDVIEHIPEPAETLKIIHSLLKPDGFLLVNYPDIESGAARLLGDRWPFWLSVHLLYYTRKTMANQLRRTGFEPLWFQSGWQTLPLGYTVRRAAPYFSPVKILSPMLDALHMSNLSFTYNMGQTLAVARYSPEPAAR